MANEAGSPELIYRFLALASHHAAWHTRGGAGVALEALLHSRARATLGPHLQALIPRLFRYM
jgi:proteasome component ECM29